jgi:hypothetical protein
MIGKNLDQAEVDKCDGMVAERRFCCVSDERNGLKSAQVDCETNTPPTYHSLREPRQLFHVSQRSIERVSMRLN